MIALEKPSGKIIAAYIDSHIKRIVTCIPIARQQTSKHKATAVNT
jgi:mRNA degradation ribonuclease J1/J2